MPKCDFNGLKNVDRQISTDSLYKKIEKKKKMRTKNRILKSNLIKIDAT